MHACTAAKEGAACTQYAASNRSQGKARAIQHSAQPPRSHAAGCMLITLSLCWTLSPYKPSTPQCTTASHISHRHGISCLPHCCMIQYTSLAPVSSCKPLLADHPAPKRSSAPRHQTSANLNHAVASTKTATEAKSAESTHKASSSHQQSMYTHASKKLKHA